MQMPLLWFAAPFHARPNFVIPESSGHILPFILLVAFLLTIGLRIWPAKKRLHGIEHMLLNMKIHPRDCIYVSDGKTLIPNVRTIYPGDPLPWLAQVNEGIYEAVIIQDSAHPEDTEIAWKLVKPLGVFITLREGSVLAVIRKH